MKYTHEAYPIAPRDGVPCRGCHQHPATYRAVRCGAHPHTMAAKYRCTECVTSSVAFKIMGPEKPTVRMGPQVNGRKPFYADLADLPEDERIQLIAHHVLAHGLTVAVCVADEPGKPERYTEKLRALGVVVRSQDKGPVANVVTLKVGPANAN